MSIATSIKQLFNFQDVPNDVKLLEFSEEYVTQCIANNLPVFEWDGTKGDVSEYSLKETAGEWKLKIVSPQSTPDRGMIVAVPTGRRTSRIYKQAKVEEMKRMGVNEAFSRIYLARSRNVRYNMDPEVIDWVYRHYLMPVEHIQSITEAKVPRGVAQTLGYNVGSVPQTRFNVCMDLIRIIRRGDAILEFAATHLHLQPGAPVSEYLNDLEPLDFVKAMALVHDYNKLPR